MYSLKLKWVMFLLIAMLSVGITSAQQLYESVQRESDLKIHGTSSLHDWAMDVNNFDCEMIVKMNGDEVKIESVKLNIVSSSITEGNSIMDDKAHTALKVKRYPEITFKSNTASAVKVVNKNISGYVKGNLTIAGKSRLVSIPYSGKIISASDIEIEGAKDIKMSDYGITPPTAMMGTLKTGDGVKIRFTIKANNALAEN